MSEEENKPLVYIPKSDADLETLAQDVVAGRVFHSLYHLPLVEDPVEAFRQLQSSFMVLALAGSDTFDFIEANEITAVYAKMSDAGPMAVNGRPVFFSMSMLNAEDQSKLHAKVLEIDAFMTARKQGGGQ